MNKLGINLFAALWIASVAYADRYEKLFPPRIATGQTQLDLKGVSKLTVGYFFDVYVAALYQLGEKGPDDTLTDTPHHLEIHYLRNISKEDFIEAADDMLAKQHSEETIRLIRDGINRINQAYEDVKKGDRYSLTYLPGYGTELKFNGESKVIIPGSDFARIYLSIWLGEKSPYRDFRDRLVGLRP